MNNWLSSNGTSIRQVALFAVAFVFVFMASVWVGASYNTWTANADSARPIDPSVRQDFKEPVTLASKDGVLEVVLTARQGQASLDTVAKPVENFLLFSYEVKRGEASNGQTTGDNLYPSPTLHVEPGDQLIIHLQNALADLTIRDFYNPQFVAKGDAVPIYPEQLTQSPLNLHTHGLRVSPKGNSDNVLLHIGAGLSNTYVYDIREDHPHGAYWYHPHLHGLTAPHVYYGMAGILQIGRLDGNLPVVTDNDLPIRNMALQYNFVFDRAGGLAQLRNPNWSQFVSTLTKPKGDELADGTYRPLLAPVNFLDSAEGTLYRDVWHAGPLSIYNNRGQFMFVPNNLRIFSENANGSGVQVAANPALPDYQRDAQFTVNGQFQPVLESKAGQTEIWVLSNIAAEAYIKVRLTETATGHHPKIAIVGEDGNPSPEVHYPLTEDGTTLVIPPATRIAIAVTLPDSGDLILEMPPMGAGAAAVSEQGVLYRNDGTDNPPAVIGTVTVTPDHLSYDDGFFVMPTQVLLRATTSDGKGKTVTFTEGQALNAPNTGYEDLSTVEPDTIRKLDAVGGFFNEKASSDDPKTFAYTFNGQQFPNAPVLQPRLNSVEEWQITNYNNDGHPIHVHVNDFQVVNTENPVTGLRSGIEKWFKDTANLPRPAQVRNVTEDTSIPGRMSLRTRFEHYTGLYVMHCHRLNHEDNGMMLLVNVIPEVSSYAVVAPGGSGEATRVEVRDGNGDAPIATVTPFPGFEGEPSVTMGDVDNDGIYDLIVGAGEGHAPEVVVYSGAAAAGRAAFETELVRFEAFGPDATGGVSVASSQIDGTTADNIIVGSGPGIASQVKIFAYDPSAQSGAAPAVFAQFSPYPGDRSGVTVAAGFVSMMSGRNSIVTANGPGRTTRIRVFDFWLMTPLALQMRETNRALEMCTSADGGPSKIADFAPFGSEHKDGVSLAAGWLYGEQGGAMRIVAGELAGKGEVKVFSTGSALQGAPSIYLRPPDEHGVPDDFSEDFAFTPFAGTNGVRVATTSTTVGADLLVSGVDETANTRKVLKYALSRPNPKTADLEVKQISEVSSGAGTMPVAIGGD